MGDEGREEDALLDAISAVLPPVMTGLEALGHVGRHLHPPNLPQLAGAVASMAAPVADGLARFREADFPEHLQDFSRHVIEAAELVGEAFDGLQQAASSPDGAMRGYRAMGKATRATEALYPLASMLPPVSRFFVEPDQRDDQALLERLMRGSGAEGQRREEQVVGVVRAGNEPGERGGFSLFVPEYYDDSRSWPVMVAMHGGSGNGHSFLWTWLRTARSRGVILLSPTARGDTWSLMGPDVDSANIDAMLGYVGERWNIDRSRMLLTGMSDGGTFSYVSGLRGESPFTHLAPCSASFHPFLLEAVPAERLKDLPIYLIHGALDWMFPIDIARTASAALTGAGANVTYRELGDLSHTWPRDENPRILDWFLAG